MEKFPLPPLPEAEQTCAASLHQRIQGLPFRVPYLTETNDYSLSHLYVIF